MEELEFYKATVTDTHGDPHTVYLQTAPIVGGSSVTVDATLSTPGQVADAAAVGQRLGVLEAALIGVDALIGG